MNDESLSEEEMRNALFGSTASLAQAASAQSSASSTPVRRSKALVSRMRVTLHVTKTFEGPEEVFVHDANTLSTLIAEGEAKAAAKKKKFRYFQVVSVEPVQV